MISMQRRHALTLSEMDAFARKEVADWGTVIRDNNITID